ncbi:MAG: hypothetical protein DWQ40_03845 [Actinobacteria bacterium]|nr:MAG: hypothetical protein DWQ40_03845 [Actinomycetota bacterium]
MKVVTQFQASLIASGDPQPLPTTVELKEGKLSIASNGQALGDWPLETLEFERVVGGVKLTLDGEVAVLKLTDSDQFHRQLVEESSTDTTTKTKTKTEKRKTKTKTEKRKKDKKVKETRASRKAREESAPAREASTAKAEAADKDGFLERLDEKLEVASKKWDRYLPDWAFTRGGVAVALLLLIAILVFRVFFSYLFLIVAAIGMITSAIALLDQVIATRIFRGGFTPIHGLIGSIHGLIGSLVLVLISLLLAAL